MTTYEMYGKAVVIKDGSEKIVLDIPNLKQAISNIEASREIYATEEAYQADLAKHQAALLFAEGLG